MKHVPSVIALVHDLLALDLSRACASAGISSGASGRCRGYRARNFATTATQTAWLSGQIIELSFRGRRFESSCGDIVLLSHPNEINSIVHLRFEIIAFISSVPDTCV
jgi:hypothetical protein